MDTQWIIGALAFVTIGLVLAVSVYHFGVFLKDPRNRGHAANFVAGGKSATTQVQEQAPSGSYNDRPLTERLDDSPASSHPDDPSRRRT